MLELILNFLNSPEVNTDVQNKFYYPLGFHNFLNYYEITISFDIFYSISNVFLKSCKTFS